ARAAGGAHPARGPPRGRAPRRGGKAPGRARPGPPAGPARGGERLHLGEDPAAQAVRGLEGGQGPERGDGEAQHPLGSAALLTIGQVRLDAVRRLRGQLAVQVRGQVVLHGAAHARLLAGDSAPDCHLATARATLSVARWMRLLTAASLAERTSAMSRYAIPSNRQRAKAVRSRSLSRAIAAATSVSSSRPSAARCGDSASGAGTSSGRPSSESSRPWPTRYSPFRTSLRQWLAATLKRKVLKRAVGR